MANRSGRLYFGVSDTPKGNLVKEVIIRNPGDLTDNDELDLQVGDELIVKFNNGNNEEVYPQLKLMVNDPAQDVGPTGAIPTVTYPGYNEWSEQQLVGFVYCCGKIAGDIITGADAEFDQAQTATASFTSEETFLNEVQSTPGTYQFTYHVAETEETEEIEETTGAWYLNEQIVNLTVYGISCENQVDEDTIIVNVAYVEEHTEDETYYWKAFQIDKATADTYGVTKLVTDANDLTGEDDERPVGWNVIDDEIDEKLSHLTLSYDDPTVPSGSTIPTDWGTINLNRPDESISSITLPPIIDSTNDLINNGEDGRGKFWSSTTNNYFYDNSLGIGYLYDAPENSSEGNDGTIHTIIPWYRPDKLPGSTATPQLLTTMGWGSLEAYQNDWKDADNAAVAPDPQTRIYGNSIRLGIGKNNLPIGEQNTEKFEVGTTDTTIPSFTPLFWINGESANFEVPVNINNGINIGGITLSSYVDSKIIAQINNLKPLFKYGTIESMVLTYPAFNNSDKDHDFGSIPENLAFKAQAAIAEASANEYAAVYRDSNSSGNLYMYIKKINGYRPLIIRSWNVNMYNNNGAADDFYVWECFLEDVATDHPKVCFGLQNTLKDSLKCRFKVGVLYVKDEFYNYVGSLKTPKPSN